MVGYLPPFSWLWSVVQPPLQHALKAFIGWRLAQLFLLYLFDLVEFDVQLHTQSFPTACHILNLQLQLLGRNLC